MPTRNTVAKATEFPSAAIYGLLLLALAGIFITSVIAGRSLRELDRVDNELARIDAYADSLSSLRSAMQRASVSVRAFAITGDESELAAAELAAQSGVNLAATLPALGASYASPEQWRNLKDVVDATAVRLERFKAAGSDGAAVALELARAADAAGIRLNLEAALDAMVSAAAEQRQALHLRSTQLQRALALWLPLLAALALGLGVGAAFLIRAQMRARAHDQARFRAIFDNSFQFSGLLSPQGILLEVNQSALQFAGTSADAVLGRPGWETPWWSADEATSTQLRAAVARAAAGEFVRYPVDLAGVNGERRRMDFSLKPVRDANGAITFLVPEARDVTDLHIAEEALAKSEERWNFALTGSDLGVWDWNVETNAMFFSDRYKSMLGYAPDEMGGTLDEWSSRIHPDDVSATMAAVTEHLEGRTSHYASVHRLRAKDGSWRDILDRGMVVSRDASGKPLRLTGTHQDLTEGRKTEAAVRRLQEQLTAVLRHSPSLIAVFDTDGRYLRASDSIAALLGKPISEIVDHSVHELFPPEFAEAIHGRISKVLLTGRMLEVEDDFNVSGSPRHFRTALFPMRDDSGAVTAVGTVAIDMTEAHRTRMRLEAALAENRVLQGMLSICAQCKRIRDGADQQWKPVESYVEQHSAAVFSHGLCPTCVETLLRESGLDDGPT